MNYCALSNYFVRKFKFISVFFLDLYHEEPCTVVHLPLILIYGDYLFAIIMKIYHELSEYPYILTAYLIIKWIEKY